MAFPKLSQRVQTLLTITLLFGVASVTSGCASAILGAGAATGVAVAQERSVGNAVDDTSISVRIAALLFNHDTELFTKVGHEVVEGRVLLTGAVQSPEHRIEAARISWRVDGVREVINEIQVSDTTGVTNAAKDTWITTQMRARILGDGEVSDINYNVETVNGTVYLIGIAQDRSELERVTNHARTISGVEKVISHVRLKDDPRRNS